MAKRDARVVGDDVGELDELTKADLDRIAEWIIDEQSRRARNRGDLEKQWDEIDRQLRMDPDTRHKRDASGKPDGDKAWMSETELPLQAQSLEMLNADCRRLKFPPVGSWFRARAALTDEYMERFQELPSPTGSDNEPPSAVNQDVGDKLAMGLLEHWHSQYDFKGHYDQIDTEAFKYGTGIGRVRPVTKKVVMDTAMGVISEDQTLPILVPQQLRDTYLDDRSNAMAAEGFVVGPVQIFKRTQILTDLRLAAAQGRTDPTDEQMGGWMPDHLNGVQSDKDDRITTLEAEGDLVIPRSNGETLYLPSIIVSIAVGEKRNSTHTRCVFRLRYRNQPFSSYLIHPYHVESLTSPYATSPLMKGWPIQAAASQALNRINDSGLLNVLPPLNYSPDDPHFAANGGPAWYPGASYPSSEGVNAVRGLSDPSAMLQAYQALVQQYYDVVGVNQPRLGAQTVSHTTAFAKQSELARGQIRTVDYVRASLGGPMTKLLEMEYQMGRSMMAHNRRLQYFIEPWNEYVFIRKGHLPDTVFFQAIGASTSDTEDAEQQERMQAVQMAMQIDNTSIQLGNQPQIDHTALIEQILRDGGWQEIPFLNSMTAQAERQQAGAGQMPGILTQAPQGRGGV